MTVQEFVGTLFEIETTAHIAHLQTTSFAQHKALGSLYEDIVGLRDRYIESVQGRQGEIIKGYKITVQPEGIDMIKYLRKHALSFQEYSNTLKDSFLKQIIDDINELLYSTIYKLQFLK